MGMTPTSEYERQIKSPGGIYQNATGSSPTIAQGLNMTPTTTAPVFQMTPPESAYSTGYSPQEQASLLGTIPVAEESRGLLSGLSGGGGVSNLLGAGAGALLAQQAYRRLGNIGDRAMTGAEEIAQLGLEQTQFRPFTVTSATGGMFGVDPQGGTTMTLSPEEQALQSSLLGGAGQFFGQAQMPTAEREAAIYDRMRATMSPEEERQRLALEERLASQGRLGVRTAQYGGAPEQFAMAQAQEEARNRAMLGAMQQAQTEQAQQAALGQQFLGSGYIPQGQLIAATQPAMTTAQIQQRGQLEGAGLFGEARMSGLEALLSSGIGQANLFGQIGSGLLSQSLQPVLQPQSSSIEDLIKQYGIGKVQELLGLGG